ncbi:MAG: hypothetical protein AABW63_00940 [Nanoarchaeota archaeon]
MTSIEEIFSEGHMRAYSEVCLKLALSMPDQFKNNHLDTLVLPSRGAVPIFAGTLYGMGKLKDAFGGDHEEFYKSLQVQDMIKPLLHDQNNFSPTLFGRKHNVLLIPFTADLNVHNYDPNLSENDQDGYVEKTRNFWARVTRAFCESPRGRAKDPYFVTFNDFVLRNLEGRDDLAKAYETFPKIDRFGIMDTVISGRASNQILGAFDQIFQEGGQDVAPYYAFLVVDDNDRKLKREYRLFLKTKERQGQLELHKVPRIVSEDQGASLLGVASVVYPSIMKESGRRLVLNNGREFFVGAGSWRLGSDLGKQGEFYKESFGRFKNFLFSGIDHIFARDYEGKEEGKELDKFREEREKFLAYADEHSIMRSQGIVDPSVLRLNKGYSVERPYETGSRVAHLPFSPDSTKKAITYISHNVPGVICTDCDEKK